MRFFGYRFLQEVRAAGNLTEKQERLAHLPIVSIIPIVGKIAGDIAFWKCRVGFLTLYLARFTE